MCVGVSVLSPEACVYSCISICVCLLLCLLCLKCIHTYISLLCEDNHIRQAEDI